MSELSFDMFHNCSRDLYENYYELAVGMIGKHTFELVDDEEYGKTLNVTHELDEEIEEKLERIIKYSLPEKCYKLPNEYREAYKEFYNKANPLTEREAFRTTYFPCKKDNEEREDRIDRAYRQEVIQHAKNIWYHAVLCGKTTAFHLGSKYRGAYSIKRKNEDKDYATLYESMIPDDITVSLDQHDPDVSLYQGLANSCYEYDDAAYLTAKSIKEELESVNPGSA
jgi:hypothetical protein